MIKQLMLLLGLSMAIFPVKAADLARALDAGKVCETSNGYIQATPGNEGETAGLVERINTKRKDVYSNIAKKDGLDPVTVGIQSAEQEKAANPGKFCR